MDNIKSAQRLKKLRKGKGLSHKKLSEELEKLGISVSDKMLMNYEAAAKQAESGFAYSKANTINGMKIETAVGIAEYFKVSVDYLVGRTDIPTAETNVRAICEYTGLSEKAVKNLNENSPSRQFRLVFDNEIDWETTGIISVINRFLENEDLSPFNGIYFYKETIKKALEVIKTSVKEKNIADSSYQLYQDAIFHLFTANEDFTNIVKKIVPEREEYEDKRLEYSKFMNTILSKGGEPNG